MPVPEDTNNEDPLTMKRIPFEVGVEWGKLDKKRRNQAYKEKKSEPKLRNLSRVALKAKQRTIRMRLPPQLQTEYHVTVATSSSRSSNRSRGDEDVTTRDDDRAFTWTGDKRKRRAEGREADDGSDGRASKRSRNGECAPNCDGTPARPQTVEKRKRPADDHGADADSDGHSSKRMRDGNRAPTRNGARASNNHAPVATRSVPSKTVPSTHAPAARPTAARPSTLPRPVPSESVPTTRATTTRAISPRSPTRPRTAPSDRAPATRAPATRAPIARAPIARAPIARAPIARAPIARAPIARAPIARAPATHTPNPSHPASSKAVRSPDARHGVPLSKDVEKGAPSTEDAIKLQSEEKRSPPKEKVSSVEGEGVDLLMESVFMPGLPSAFVDRLLRNIVQRAQDDNAIRSELLGRCQDILDEYPILDKEAKDRLRAAKASKEHGDLPWPFLRRVRAKVLYKAIDKETPLTDFEEACQEDLAKLFVRGSKPRTPTDDNPKLKI